MVTRDRVLLVTHSGDSFTVDRVAEGVAARGARPLRVDTDLFPTELGLSIGGGPSGFDLALTANGETVTGDEVAAVWHRRVWPPRLDDDLDETFREGCVRESRATLAAWLAGLEGARHVDPPFVVAAADDKPRQLRAARTAGLAVPRTLVTNDPARVRAFRRELSGEMVTKMLTPLSQSMQGRGFFVHTSLVRDEDLDDLDALCLCPMVFQERVAKRVELRAIFVAGALFTGAIDATRSAGAQVDWRLAKPGEVSWQRGEVPDEVADKLRAMMRALGLTYGAVDLIVTPEGEHVFLEVNPAGEWGMIERDLGLPIGDAIAGALLTQTP